MQYMHWENTKKKLPAIFLDPMMSQNFSSLKTLQKLAENTAILVFKTRN